MQAGGENANELKAKKMVEQMGFEPTTSALQGRRSPKLNYCPTRTM